MATGQDLLNQMMVLDNELLLGSGEADVTRGLLALNMAQDMFESVVAGRPDLYGDGVTTIAVTAGSESTAFPTTVLRLDKMWMLDPATSRPIYELDKIDRVGGHAFSSRWWDFGGITSPGRVDAYWTDGRNVYWSPFPGQSDTVRVYGFMPAADITAGGTFAYPDLVMLPLAAYATKLMKIGVGDATLDLDAAVAAFGAVVDALSNFNRDRAPKLIYTTFHDT